MGVASLGYVAFETADPDRWDDFLLKTVGLAPAAANGPARRYRMDEVAWRVEITPGTREALAAVGLQFAADGELDACLARLKAAGVGAEEDAGLAEARGARRLFKAQDPAGAPLELYVGRALGYEHFASPAGVSGFVTGQFGDMGLGHVVLPAPDIEASRRFWLDVIGLGLTDEMSFLLAPEVGPQKLYFMHADNARHHSVAIFEAPVPSGLVHVMFETHTIDDVGRFIDRCERDGVHIGSALGRHSNDQMVSVYVVTPGGFMLEFGYDGLKIDWKSWIPTRSLVPDTWGHKFMGPPDMPAI